MTATSARALTADNLQPPRGSWGSPALALGDPRALRPSSPPLALAGCLALPAVAAAAAAPAPRAAATRLRGPRRDNRARDAWEAKVREADQRPPRGPRPQAAQGGGCPDSFAEPWTRHLARTQILAHQDLNPMLGCPAHVVRRGEHRLRL